MTPHFSTAASRCSMWSNRMLIGAPNLCLTGAHFREVT